MLGTMYFTSDNGYQNFLGFAAVLSSLILDSNKKVSNCISTETSFEKMKPFNTNAQLTMSNLANGRVILTFNNSVLVQESSSSLHSNFILYNWSLHFKFIHNWSRNPADNFPLKNCLFGTAKLVRNATKSQFIYNGWGIALDGEGSWSFDNDLARNVIIFGVDNNLSSHTANWINNFLILGERPRDGINDSTGAAGKKIVSLLVGQIQNFPQVSITMVMRVTCMPIKQM